MWIYPACVINAPGEPSWHRFAAKTFVTSERIKGEVQAQKYQFDIGTLTKMKFAIILISTFVATASASLLPRSGSPLTQAQAQSRLQAAGISATSSGGCTIKSDRSCTSYDGILSGTVDGVITLKGACGCAIIITGGTETGHASGTYSHANGYKVDIRKDAGGIDTYVHKSFTKIANRGDGYPQWKSAAGNIYCDEGSHWDVLYY